MKRDPKTLAMAASLGIAVLMLVGKLTAYFLTGSKAIFSDAAESIVHIAATAVAAASLWYAAKPADEEHLYGHGKVAYFSAGFEGAFILAAALAILWESVQALIMGPELQRLGIGIVITGSLGLVNLGLGWTLVAVGRKHRSVVLEANGKHVLTDMWTSFAVVAGVTVVWITGIAWLDPIIAMAAGLHILFSAGGLMRRSFHGLLDGADPEVTEAVLGVLERAVEHEEIASFHHLRHRESNDETFVEAHLLVSGRLPTVEAHARATRIEEAIRAAIDSTRVHVITHIEPADHESAHPGGHALEADPLVEEKGPPNSRDERARTSGSQGA